MSRAGEKDYPFKKLITWEGDRPPTEFTAEHLEELLGPMIIKRDISNEYGNGFVGFMGKEEDRVDGNGFLAVHVFKTVHNVPMRTSLPKTLPTVEIGHGQWKIVQDKLLPSKSIDRQRVERVEQIQLVQGRAGDDELVEWLMFKGTSGMEEVILHVGKDRRIVYSREPASREDEIPSAIEEVNRLKNMVGAEGLEPPTLSV